jgi:dipeptidyl aminopeptidase/acylaminoacyl peptidase
MLIAQGANDPRVVRSESDQIVAAIARNNGRATYVLDPDEGHGLPHPLNHMDFTARAEKFLAEHLGGRYEPMEGERMPGSTAIAKVIDK